MYMILKLIQKLIATLNSDGTPGQVAAGMAIGTVFGLTPLLNLHNLLILSVVVLVRVTFPAVMLGWFNSALGLGMVLGGLVLSAWGGFRKKIVTTLLAIVAMGGSLFLIAVAPSKLYYVAVAGFFLSGSLMAIGNGCLRATFRGVVHPAMQGRVGALMGSLATAMSPIGLAIAGPTADAIGVRSWFVIAGAVLLLGGLAGLWMPALRRIESEAEERKAEQSDLSTPEGTT